MTPEARHKLPDNHKQMILRNEMETLKANLDIHLQYQSMFAQIARAKYLALKEQGFTSEEALVLCK